MAKIQPFVVGTVFTLAGALHFVKPAMYEAIVPPFLPAHRAIVLVSGAFEMLGGIGVMFPQTRVAAGWGLIALLLAVFPANVYMAIDPKFDKIAPAWALYLRLPLQFGMIGWVYAACIAAGMAPDGEDA
jgi:uncharacterized membrane protein